MNHNHTSESWTEADQQASEPDFYGKWISVEDRLPETIGSYLVWNKPEVEWAFYNSDGVWCRSIGYFVDKKVTHWMNLPKPPNESV